MTSPLLVWASSDLEAQNAARVLKSAASEDIRLCDSLEGMRRTAEAEPDALLCLLYTAPARHLGHRLKQGMALQEVSGQWRAQTSGFLALYRQNRARCTLLESAHLRRFSDTALARMGVPGGLPLAFDHTDHLDPDSELWALVANAYLNERTDMCDLAEELAASSTILSNDAVLEEPVVLGQDALSALQTQGLRMAQQNADLEELKAERDTLDLARQTLEVKLAETKGAQDSLEKQATLLLSELRQATAHLAQKTHEAEGLTKDLAHQTRLQKEQEQKITGIESDRDARIHGLNAEIHRIMTSRSMRLTAPLRTVLRLLGRKPDV